MTGSAASTVSRTRVEIAPAVSLETFILIHRAILHREQLWGYCKGQPVRLCPHALGWRATMPTSWRSSLATGASRPTGRAGSG
jgi:hypothetical protein